MEKETVSMRHQITVPLDEHEFLVKKLMETLDQVSRPPMHSRNTMDTAKKLFKQMLETDRQVMDSVDTLILHQKNEQELKKITTQIQAKDDAIVNYAKTLRKAEQSLRGLMKKHKKLIESCDTKETRQVNAKDLVAYAHRIAGTTSAPSYWKPGLPMFGFTPPAPQEPMMRAGVLSRGVIDEIVTKEHDIEAEKLANENNVISKENLSESVKDVPLGISIPDGDIRKMMPPGWKVGDPIVLPKEVILPHLNDDDLKGQSIQLPTNWKPGDAISIGLTGKEKRLSTNENNDKDSKKRKVDDEEEEEEDSDEDSEDSESDDDEEKQKISLSLSSDEDDDDDSD